MFYFTCDRSSWETHLRATERYLPYGITVLPATRHKWTRPALTSASKLIHLAGGPEEWKAELT